jgi:lipopolysaccharide transport system permease protein/teichoic acid transport system permease protein
MALKTAANIIRMGRTFSRELTGRRDLIFSLSVRNFRALYHGSILGFTWMLLEPLVFVFLLWFFFTKALKTQPPQGYPYAAWLMTPMVLWSFISFTLSSAASTFKAHAFLLKRPEFNMSVLPVVNIMTGIYVHSIFVLLLVGMLLLSDVTPTLYWLQAIYYLFAAAVLLLGLAWISASVGLFAKDVGNVIAVSLQIGFWVSPIFWSPDTFPEEYRLILELNPATYLLEGYRKSFLYARPFWSDVSDLVYFWTVTLAILGIGVFTYKKLRPHFGDVV